METKPHNHNNYIGWSSNSGISSSCCCFIYAWRRPCQGRRFNAMYVCVCLLFFHLSFHSFVLSAQQCQCSCVFVWISGSLQHWNTMQKRKKWINSLIPIKIAMVYICHGEKKRANKKQSFFSGLLINAGMLFHASWRKKRNSFDCLWHNRDAFTQLTQLLFIVDVGGDDNGDKINWNSSFFPLFSRSLSLLTRQNNYVNYAVAIR